MIKKIGIGRNWRRGMFVHDLNCGHIYIRCCRRGSNSTAAATSAA